MEIFFLQKDFGFSCAKMFQDHVRGLLIFQELHLVCWCKCTVCICFRCFFLYICQVCQVCQVFIDKSVPHSDFCRSKHQHSITGLVCCWDHTKQPLPVTWFSQDVPVEEPLVPMLAALEGHQNLASLQFKGSLPLCARVMQIIWLMKLQLQSCRIFFKKEATVAQLCTTIFSFWWLNYLPWPSRTLTCKELAIVVLSCGRHEPALNKVFMWPANKPLTVF